ncbi:MAG: biotin transporter BioY, partial [Calditrichota bacterium]
MTYADILRPQLRSRAVTYDILLIMTGSLLLGLLAQVRIPLPFTPVPVTGQTFGVLLLGTLLGRARGTLTVLAYLGEGVAGMPVFAGAAAGPAILLGPTGGYLIGFLFAAYVVGRMAEAGWDRKMGTTVLMMSIGTGIIYLVGLLGLMRFVPGNLLLETGLLPFLPGGLIKIIL